MGEKKIEVVRKRSVSADVETKQVREHVCRQILEFLESGIKQILKNPHSVAISVNHEGDYTSVFEVDVSREDFGRLLGNKGKTINALRVLIMAIAGTHNFRAVLKVKDEERFF